MGELRSWIDQQIAGIQQSSMVEMSLGALNAFEQVKRKLDELGVESELDEVKRQLAAYRAQLTGIGIVPYLDRMNALAARAEAAEAKLAAWDKVLPRDPPPEWLDEDQTGLY